jgi:ATP-binding cassette, subfamily B, multidrug efflux pump
MIKIMKYLRKLDWLFLSLIAAFTVLQVYCTITLTDAIKDLMNAIILAYSGTKEEKDIWLGALTMVGFATASMACQCVSALFASLISASLVTSLRKKLNDKVSEMSMSQIEAFSTSSLITRATNDVQQVGFTFVMASRMLLSAPTTAIWAICKIQAVSGELTLLTAGGIALLLLFLILMFIFLLPRFKVVQKLIDKVNLIAQENLSGIRVIRAYNAESYQEGKFSQANKDLTKIQIFTSRLSALMNPVLTIIMNLLSLGIYWLGATLINGHVTDYATLTGFSTLASMIIMAFMMLMFMFIMIPRAEISASRINEVLDSQSEIADPTIETPLKEKGTIEFSDVSFHYGDASEEVVSHISFKVNRGETLAIIGATGSGKSTILRLAARFYDVNEGSIKIDGVDVRQMKEKTLRKVLSLVPQKGLLFSGSIKSNIAFANANMDEEKIHNAARIAMAEEFILALDGGYEATIARGGSNVSGGQRQRLCIARAIASDPEICLFDDSFSALDFKTDLQVRKNLKEALGETTKIIVAQRIGTIMDAENIIVLHEGKIVGQGRHKELLSSCQEYREIALSQLSKEELGL